MPKTSVVVVDSSTTIYTVLDYPLSSHVEAHWKTWIDPDGRFGERWLVLAGERLLVCAPDGGQARILVDLPLKEISEASVQDALNAVLSLGVELFDEDAVL